MVTPRVTEIPKPWMKAPFNADAAAGGARAELPQGHPDALSTTASTASCPAASGRSPSPDRKRVSS
jgi:hypothetical protein